MMAKDENRFVMILKEGSGMKEEVIALKEKEN